MVSNKSYKYGITYFIAIISGVILVFANQIFIQYALNKYQTNNQLINLINNQKLTSQRIALLIYKNKENTFNPDELHLALNTWFNNHSDLKYGNELRNIPTIENKEILLKLYYLDKNLIFLRNELKTNTIFDSLGLMALFENQDYYLKKMDVIENELQLDNDKFLLKTIVIEFVFALLSIIIIILEFRYFFKPLNNQVKEQTQTIKEGNIALMECKNKLKSILDCTNDIYILFDLDYNIQLYNTKAEQEIKLLFNKQIKLNSNFLSTIFPEYAIAFKEDISKALTNGNYKIDRQIKTSEQQIFWYELRYFSVYDSENELKGISFNARSINEQKKAEEKVNKQIKTLGEIAWFQSHELRKPLANILGILPLIEPDSSHPENEKLINYLFQETKNLDNLIKTISNKTEA
ncbi:MAG: PAS domain S-box protein [Bacteroidia bacterium]